MKKIFKYMLAASFICAACFGLASCGDEKSDKTQSQESTDKIDYTVNLKCINGKPIKDATLTMVVDGKEIFTKTDAYGNGTFNLLPGDYTIEIEKDSIPGYTLENYSYNVTSSIPSVEAVAQASLIDDTMPSGHKYALGDVMYDFDYETVFGENKSLSTALEDHDLVIINFWYKTCTYCIAEFPSFFEAYENNKDNVYVIGVDTTDNLATVLDFINKDTEIPYDVVVDRKDIVDAFSIRQAPISIFIDRYGLIGEIHIGGINEVDRWEYEFNKFIGDDYEPKFNGSIDDNGDTITSVKPTVDPVESSVLEAAANGSNFSGTYYGETGTGSEYNWPWIATEDGTAIKPSNYDVNSSYSIVNTKFKLGPNKVLAFDYKKSCEPDDVLYVFVDGIKIIEISGNANDYDTCYLYATDDDIEHILSFSYIKNDTFMTGDDCVYINNIRYIDQDDINEEFYLIKKCAYGEYNPINKKFDGYSNVVFNETDGFYHVDDSNGPLVLCDLQNPTLWNKENSLYSYAIDGNLTFDGVDYSDIITKYSIYQNNSSCGYTSVTKELYDALNVCVSALGNKPYDEQWLELCSYYQPYGTNKQLEDPIKGLGFFDTFEAVLGDQNFVTYDRIIVPRGLYYSYTPVTSGVYYFTTYSEADTLGWIFSKDGLLYESMETVIRDDMIYLDTNGKYNPNFGLYCYLAAGETYYFDAAFYNVDQMGTLQFGIEHIGDSLDVLTACSLGYYTTDSDDWDGTDTGNIVSIGVDVALQDDGYYHYVDKDGNVGSVIYVDVDHTLSVIESTLNNAILGKGFDFTKDAEGNEVTGDNAFDATAEMMSYIANNKINEGRLSGCIMVDARLKTLLELFMWKWDFAGVEGSWLKLCYYDKHFGA